MLIFHVKTKLNANCNRYVTHPLAVFVGLSLTMSVTVIV